MAAERADRFRAAWPLLAATALLLWPAAWNGYPIVFADSGTYLSQAINHYLGWDRPVVYSLALLPLHLTLTTWPVIVAQAVLTAVVLRLVMRLLLPGAAAWWLVPFAGLLAVATWLPWIVSELMPDFLTPLLVLVLAALVLAPDRLRRRGRIALSLAAAFMIATQQSSLPLSLALIVVLLALRRRLGGQGRARIRPVLAAPALAIAALVAINLIGFGRMSVSPFGNVFLLARVIYDGPGMDALRTSCPHARWRLCPYLDRLPGDSDAFLWQPDSPLNMVGGPRVVSAEAGGIILAAVRAEPVATLRAALRNTLTQLAAFQSGDGLQPWQIEVTPWLGRDFPDAELGRYQSARQQHGALAVPPWLATLHVWADLAGIAAASVLLVVALRRRDLSAGFLAAALLVLPVGAAITGALSAPHDRYQSRIMWLPLAVSLLAAPRLVRRSA